MRVTLAVTEGPHLGQTFSFAGHETFLVGRSKRAHFRLPRKDRYFSRIHFLVEVNPPHCRLLDMGSRNGTHVNGQRVQRALLRNGDRIRAGKTVLSVSVEEEPGEKETADNARPPTTPAAPARPQELAIPIAPAIAPQPVGGSSRTGPPERSRFVPSAPALRCSGCDRAVASFPPGTIRLCPACLELTRGQPQPIPGYLLLRKLGQGAMGTVSLAVRAQDGQALALKTITPAVAGSQAQVQRFLREADILRQLQHPNIVRCHDLGEATGVFYFAMDYVAGSDAARLLKRDGRFPPGRAVALVCQLLEALSYAHGQRFVHRDIKPSNLLVTEEAGQEIVKVVDFGLARVYQASQFSGLTLTGEIGGTMAFIPPEQITSYRDARPAADQFAAAATLYNLLTSCYIHDLPSEFHQQVLVILQDDPVPIAKRRSELPTPLCEAIQRALAREPEDRFPDVIAFRKELLPFRG